MEMAAIDSRTASRPPPDWPMKTAAPPGRTRARLCSKAVGAEAVTIAAAAHAAGQDGDGAGRARPSTASQVELGRIDIDTSRERRQCRRLELHLIPGTRAGRGGAQDARPRVKAKVRLIRRSTISSWLVEQALDRSSALVSGFEA